MKIDQLTENMSYTAKRIHDIEKEKGVTPGTPEWFELWFSLPYLKESIDERELTKAEIKKRDDYADDLPDAEFKKRYGKDWEAVKYGTATNMAKGESIQEGYKLQLERDADMYVLHITDTETGKRTEVRGKGGYESGNYDADDKLHQLLDRIGKASNISDLINGEIVGINPKHPDGKSAKKHADVAFNEDINFPSYADIKRNQSQPKMPTNPAITDPDGKVRGFYPDPQDAKQRTSNIMYKAGRGLSRFIKGDPDYDSFDQRDTEVQKGTLPMSPYRDGSQIKPISKTQSSISNPIDMDAMRAEIGAEYGLSANDILKYSKADQPLPSQIDPKLIPKGTKLPTDAQVQAFRKKYPPVFNFDGSTVKENVPSTNKPGTIGQKINWGGKNAPPVKKTNVSVARRKQPDPQSWWQQMLAKGKNLFDDVSVPENIFHMKNRLLKVKKITDAMGNRPIMFRSFVYDAEPVVKVIKKVTNNAGRNVKTGRNEQQSEVLQKLGIANPTFATMAAGRYANINISSLEEDEVFGLQNIFIPLSNEIYYSPAIEDLGLGRLTGGSNMKFSDNFDVDKAVATYKKGWPSAGFDNEIIVDTNEYYLVDLRSFLLELTSPEIKDQIKRLKNEYDKSYSSKASENQVNDILKDLFKTKITTYGDISRWIESSAVPFVNMLGASSVQENFKDGKVKGKSRPGRVKRAGASCDGSVTELRKKAKNASGEKAKMYHWCANMKSGRKK